MYSYHYLIDGGKTVPKIYLFAFWPGAMIKLQWLELLMVRTYFLGPKDVWASEIRLYLHVPDEINPTNKNNIPRYRMSIVSSISWIGSSETLSWTDRRIQCLVSYICLRHGITCPQTYASYACADKVFAFLILHITKTRLFKYIENFTNENCKFSNKNSKIFIRVFMLKT